MPTYEYRCTECTHEFESFQSMSADPITECPECGKKTERVISGGAGLLFKGSGFYTTDYRSEGYKQASKSDSSSSTTSSSKESSSKDSTSKSSSSGSTKPSASSKPKSSD